MSDTLYLDKQRVMIICAYVGEWTERELFWKNIKKSGFAFDKGAHRRYDPKVLDFCPRITQIGTDGKILAFICICVGICPVLFWKNWEHCGEMSGKMYFSGLTPAMPEPQKRRQIPSVSSVGKFVRFVSDQCLSLATLRRSEKVSSILVCAFCT